MHAGSEIPHTPAVPLVGAADALTPRVRGWLGRRTYAGADWDAARIRPLKGDLRVSVVLPARNEAATIGGIVAAIADTLTGGPHPVVDEILVVDSHSDDATAAVARAAGAVVAHQDAIRPDLPPSLGKGDALWKSLFAVTGDIVVFLDADVRDFTPGYVTGLLGPLLADTGLAYVKGFYDRPADPAGAAGRAGGGRVTELVARPLLNLLAPDLAGFVQPLAGEAAGRADVLRRVPFAAGYGVEIGLLLDLYALVGLDRLAQVDLGVRHHRHQDLADLGAMAAQVQAAALRRVAGRRPGRADAAHEQVRPLVQYERAAGEQRRVRVRDIRVADRPPHDRVPPAPDPAPPAPDHVPRDPDPAPPAATDAAPAPRPVPGPGGAGTGRGPGPAPVRSGA
ncbi:glucosyl-3-phosphoglycerate synthase [Nocardiopsis sediminis]|uniref:Glucosyl-3-phosphoglycerate synthase n=1 Tax=Nocardiopsis sediminis TaxID=1778267 RepID=A0ABV8FS47_9ACTN